MLFAYALLLGVAASANWLCVDYAIWNIVTDYDNRATTVFACSFFVLCCFFFFVFVDRSQTRSQNRPLLGRPLSKETPRLLVLARPRLVLLAPSGLVVLAPSRLVALALPDLAVWALRRLVVLVPSRLAALARPRLAVLAPPEMAPAAGEKPSGNFLIYGVFD